MTVFEVRGRCEECKHYELVKRQLPESFSISHEPMCNVLDGTPHPIYAGEIQSVRCDAMRMGGPCGFHGALFEAKI